MRQNTNNYSDEYQPYTGYDKFEYDIILKNGSEVTNCYPNAGEFVSFKNSDVIVEEQFVAQIRFSNNPLSDLNIEVSKHLPEYIKQQEIDEGIVDDTHAPQPFKRKIGVAGALPFIIPPEFSDINQMMDRMLDRDMQRVPRSERRPAVKVRDSKENPKIQRNEKCPCGSGKKYKHCCIIQQA